MGGASAKTRTFCFFLLTSPVGGLHARGVWILGCGGRGAWPLLPPPFLLYPHPSCALH
jgi:hypothetical protein